MKRLTLCVAAVGLICFGCNSPNARLNAPPHGIPPETHDMQGMFVYMADNGLLADMTVADRHFLPHRPLLSELGEERLCRLAALIDEYGGTIRFNTSLEDETLIGQRTGTIIAFLADLGMEATSEIVERDLAGGTGMDASEVILIKANEATYQPKQSGGGGQPFTLSFGGSGS